MKSVERQIEVLFVVPNLRPGGAERVLVNLLRHIDGHRFKVAVLICDGRGVGLEPCIPSGLEVIKWEYRRVVQAMPALVKLLYARKPEVVVSSLQHLNVLFSFLLAFIPGRMAVVAREESTPSANMPEGWRRWVFKFAYRWRYRRFDRVLVQTDSIRNDLTRLCGGAARNAEVIHNALDTHRIRDRSREIDPELTRQLNGLPFWVAVGRLSCEKGFDILLEALASGKIDASRRLFILGEGPERARLQRDIERLGLLGRVTLLGHRDNPFPWMAAAELLISPSRHEGFPNVVLEALALGTPVVATPAAGGYSDFLKPIEHCRVAKEVSAVALAEALSAWSECPPARVDPVVVEPWDASRVTGQFQHLLLAVAGQKKKLAI